MELKELRIGNLVYDGNEVITWSETNFYHITVSQKSIDDYKPIPLTEEWLVRFGFVFKHVCFERGDLKLYIHRFVDFYGKGKDKVEYILVHDNVSVVKLRSGHVHILQNTAFFLSEIEIGLDKKTDNNG